MSGRLLAAALAAALLLLLAGCGEKDEPDLATLPAEPEPIALGTALTTLAEAGDDEPEPIAGSWSGTLRQAGMKPFPISVRIASLSEPARNPVRYGGPIGCAGTWSFEGGRGAVAEFLEVIDRGAGGNCKGRGTVRLSLLPGGKLDYTFQGGGVESRGTLSRR